MSERFPGNDDRFPDGMDESPSGGLHEPSSGGLGEIPSVGTASGGLREIPSGGGLIGLLHGRNGQSLPVPFEQEIFLFDTYVAGTTHVEGIEELEPFLHPGDKVAFVREPHNPYDERAILVKNADGVKIGYIPRKDNAVFARLMDAGKELFGRITAKEMRGNWLRLSIRIYLRE